jgi:hypothetical protein
MVGLGDAKICFDAVQALKGNNEDDVDAVLDRVMMLFRYLQEKDVFEKYYKQHLAKRLLSGRAVRVSDAASAVLMGDLAPLLQCLHALHPQEAGL